MKYLIAIDAGGTKTESLLLEETGRILARDLCAGCNALDATMPVVKQRLLGAVERLHARLPQGQTLYAVYAGVAGSVDYYPGVLAKELYPLLPCPRVRMEGDGGNLIAAMQGHTDGCCLISGTGSSLYIRTGEKLQRYGGWGYLIDTGGSGYAIGRDAFLAAFRSFDGRGPHTILYELIKEQMGHAPDARIPYIYAHGRPYIASFARTVFLGRSLGDAESARIFDHAARCLAELILLGAKELTGDFNVIIGGGLFSAYPELSGAVRAQIPARAHLVPLTAPPVMGAAIEALWDAHLTADEGFKRRFLADYQALTNEKPLLEEEERIIHASVSNG